MRSASAVSVIEALGGAIEITSYAGQETIVTAGIPDQAAASPKPPDSFAMSLLR
jgi:hypothetical protein